MPEPSDSETATFLIEVWREACQHGELGDAAAAILPHLVRALPIAQLAVRELDLSRHAIETVAIAPGSDSGPSRSELRADELDAIVAWSPPVRSSGRARERYGAGCPGSCRPRSTAT